MKKKSIVKIMIATFIIFALLFTGYELFGEKILFNTNKIIDVQEEKWAYSVDKKSKTAIINKYLGNEINVVVPETVTVNEQQYTVTTIGAGTFEECEEIETINIATTVTKIEANAFRGCISLSKLYMPENVTTIGSNAFEECNNLDNINIANSESEEKIYDENYIEYLQLSEEDKSKMAVIPRKEFISIDTLGEKSADLLGTINEEDIDTSYDLRDYIDITVENQGDSSWCWAYTSLKSLDTYAALNLDVEYNSSEAHLAHMRSEYFSDDDFWQNFWSDIEGTDFTTTENIYNSGGNFFDFSYYGEYNYGPVLESAIPNTKYEMTETNRAKFDAAEKYIKLVDIEDYPSITKEYQEDGSIVYKNGDKVCTQEEVEAFRNTIKMHIMQYGGVYTSLGACPDSGTAYYNANTAAYYWEGDTTQLKRNMAHAVTIVGWDDNYSVDNFNSSLKPANKGAYLCVNSWGTSFGKSGYFYISYDDINVEEYLSGVTEAEEIPESMEITKLPTKTQFVKTYEDLDLTGGEITLTAKSGNKKVISMTDSRVSVTGYSNKTVGEITLTVKYKYDDYLSYDCSATFEVDIVEPTVTKIEATTLPNKLNYVKGYEDLDLTGGRIKITYNGNDSWNTTLSMTNSEVTASQLDNTVLGEKTITVTYKEKTTQFNVTIVEIGNIELTQIPTKTIYMLNDTIVNLTGGKITITFTNGDTRVVNTSDSGVVAGTLNASVLGETTVTLTYYTHSVSYTVEIIENYFEYTISGSYITITGYNGNQADVDIPSSIYDTSQDYVVRTIGTQAFKDNTTLVSVKIPDSVTTIENSVFEGCTSLSEIEIPDSVTTIGSAAFYKCTSIESINLPKNLSKIDAQVFRECTGLKSIEIPSKVSEIGNLAFKQCTSLTSVKIPDSVTSIVAQAFSNCWKLEDVTLPPNLTSIEDGIFSGCSSLKSITIPENVTKIESSAFYGCGLATIEIPKNVATIGELAFWSDSLKSIEVSSDNNYFSSVNGVLFNKEKSTLVFYPTGKTETIYTIPDGVETIKAKSFYSCDNLIKVQMPDSVTNIGREAFYHCLSIKMIEVSNNVTTIDKKAFAYCSSLTNINIPTSLTIIDDNVFSDCRSLKNIEIPNGVTTIGEYAFGWNDELQSVEIPSTVTTIQSNVFYDCSNYTIYTYSDATYVINYAETNSIPYEIITNPLESISISQAPTDLEYREGENFNSSGLGVTAHYQDGSTANVTEWVLLDSTTIGTDQEYVTVGYSEKGRTRTVRQAINYIGKIPESITITNPPTKTVYNALENFETDGMIVTAYYDDDTSAEITDYSVIDGENLTAGKESVTISYTKEDITVIDIQGITVNQLQGTISNVQDLSKTYDGQKVSNPTYTKVGEGEVSFGWYSMQNGSETLLSEAPTNAGDYKVKVILAESTNYKGTTVEKAFTISKATYDMDDIEFESATYTYDGTEKKIEITGILPEGVEASYQNNKGVNAGEYNAIAIFSGDSTNYNTIENKTAKLTINQAQGSISNVQDLSKTYDGQKVSNPTYTKVGDGKVSFSWYSMQNGSEISLSEAPTNVGDYKVKVILAESTNYKGVTAEKAFTISKATYDMDDIKFESATYTYDGTEKKIEITGTLPEGVEASYQNNKGVNAGEYNAVATFIGDTNNYNPINSKTAKLTITQAQGTIENVNKLDKLYDGEAVSIDGNYNITGDGEVSVYWYRIDGDSETEIDDAPINVGSYKVKLVLSDGTNYKGTELEDAFAISKATYDMSEVKFEDATYTYDGTEKKIEITGILPEGVEVNYQNNKATNVGEYDAVAMFTGDTDNYNAISNKTAKLIISARQGSISNIQDLSKVYDGEKVSNPTYTKVGDGEVSFGWYKIENGNELSLNEAPVNAGDYKVKVVLSGTTNYSGATAEKTFTISKATYNVDDIKFEDATYTYDGEEKKIEITGTLPEGVEVSYQNNKATNAGEYNAVAIFSGDGENYNSINNLMAKLTILKADPEYTLPVDVTATYGQTLADINLPTGFTWEDEETTNVGNVGQNIFKVIYTPTDTANYNILNNLDLTITVRKAIPNYTIPTGLSAEYGQTLAEINLPSGFAWEDDLETNVGEIGNNTFKVTYTPEDTNNYEIITGIDVEIKVVEKIEISVGNYYIDEENNIITKIKPNTSLGKFKQSVKSNLDYQVFNNKEEAISNDNNIGTGYKLKFTNGKEYTLVVYGDLNGDANVNIIDVARLQKIIVKTTEISDIVKLASDLKEDSNINILDLAKLQKLVIGFNIF